MNFICGHTHTHTHTHQNCLVIFKHKYVFLFIFYLVLMDQLTLIKLKVTKKLFYWKNCLLIKAETTLKNLLFPRKICFLVKKMFKNLPKNGEKFSEVGKSAHIIIVLLSINCNYLFKKLGPNSCDGLTS